MYKLFKYNKYWMTTNNRDLAIHNAVREFMFENKSKSCVIS